MELSKRLKQARLDAGLSQKALCGDRITRNMLSQIENGSARPSMDTLRYFAEQLGKPLSYFLEEDAITSPNQALMEKIRRASPADALALLSDYRSPDPTFDPERWLLEALICMDLAEAAIGQEKPGYAKALLERAQAAGAHSPYYTADMERRRLLLKHRAGEKIAEEDLPDLTPELLLRADLALGKKDFSRCAALLECVQEASGQWHRLKGQLYFAQSEYANARIHFEKAWDTDPIYCCARLEDCCRELGDFAGAYFYACKQRELNR